MRLGCQGQRDLGSRSVGDRPRRAIRISRRVAELMEERGLRAFMSIQICPPLVISKEEIDQMVAIIDESLRVS